jgi:hypothetical protein
VQLTTSEKSLMSSAVAVLARSVSAYFEQNKVMLQCQPELMRLGVDTFAQTLGPYAFVQTPAGKVALWNGNFMNCVRFFPTHTLNFVFTRAMRALGLRVDATDTKLVGRVKRILASGIGGILTLAVVYP